MNNFLDADDDLYALSWAIDDDAPDYKFYRNLLSETNGLALDAGCGTGRILRRGLSDGFAIEGCDISPSMLHHCKIMAGKSGLAPVLYQQALQNLDLPNRYSFIYVACGTIMCVTDRDEVQQAITRLWQHLTPGGRLCLSILEPTCLHLNDAAMPSPWESYCEVPLPDGTGRLVVDWRATEVRPESQLVLEECRYRLEVNGRVIREQISPDRHRWYRSGEMEDQLERNGFTDLTTMFPESLNSKSDRIREYIVMGRRPANSSGPA